MDLAFAFSPSYLPAMEIRYRGKTVTDADIAFIRRLIAENPTASRWALSFKLCEAWQWVQPNGVLRDIVCRGLMLLLHRGGHIELPPPRGPAPDPRVRHKAPSLDFEIDETEIQARLSELRSLEFLQVRRTAHEPLFNGLIERYHYLGYTRPVGEHLKYIIYAQGRPIACMAWSSAPRHLGCRDRFIGWPASVRRQNIHMIAYNLRFLILPWVRVRHLASHILSRMAKVVAADWQKIYNHPIYFLETFVDPERFRGTCYRAAGWLFLGLTTGRGKDDQSHKPNRSLKEVLGYPLSRRFREQLSGGQG